MFHIFTHAFFKACLFLGAGSVAHSGSHHSFDMKKDMGGLRKKMPITFATFMVSTLALTGVPLLSGFFSKDEIIDNAGHNGYVTFQVIGLIGAFFTTAYMSRCVYLTFFGKSRGAAAGLHHDEHGAHAVLDLHGAVRHTVTLTPPMVAAGHPAHDTGHGADAHGHGVAHGDGHAAEQGPRRAARVTVADHRPVGVARQSERSSPAISTLRRSRSRSSPSGWSRATTRRWRSSPRSTTPRSNGSRLCPRSLIVLAAFAIGFALSRAVY